MEADPGIPCPDVALPTGGQDDAPVPPTSIRVHDGQTSPAHGNTSAGGAPPPFAPGVQRPPTVRLFHGPEVSRAGAVAAVPPQAVSPPAATGHSLRGHPASSMPAGPGSGLRSRVNFFVTRVFSGVRIIPITPVPEGLPIAAASPGGEETADGTPLSS